MKAALAGLVMGSMMTNATLADDLQSLADGLVAHALIPGAIVGLVEADRLDWAVAGVRITGRDDPIERDDLWHLGSLTKSMTATVAARLVERGVIAWDDTAGVVLELPDAPGAGATLEALLTHRAGIAANPGMWRMINLPRDWSAESHHTDRQALADDVVSWPLAGNPGDFLYSNMGYMLAGQMLAVSAETSWEALIAAELFQPLGLNSPGFGPPGYVTSENQPWGHRTGLWGRLRAADPVTGPDNPPVFGPAGTVHMNAEDMLTYLRAHLIREDRYLGAESWHVLQTPPDGTDYAMGWSHMASGRLAHDGSNTFWLAVMGLDFEAGRAVFVAVNSGALDEIGPLLAEAGEAAFALP